MGEDEAARVLRQAGQLALLAVDAAGVVRSGGCGRRRRWGMLGMAVAVLGTRAMC